jgi:hypothetical protein
MTDGYREGLSVGKARVMQSGFDAGYPLGVEIGLRAGNVLGVLEGVIAALTSSKFGTGSTKSARASRASTEGEQVTTSSGPVTVSAPSPAEMETTMDATREVSSRGDRNEGELGFVRALYARAQEELKISELLKGLSDEKIAAIPDTVASNNEEDPSAEQTGQKEASLPKEIENALERWERLVFSALGQGPSSNASGPSVAKTGERAI